MSEEGSTKTDPLTKATRATKRNLLAVSLIAITFKAFDISADKIPLAGVTITYDRGVFQFLLLIVLCYCLVTFILYYYIDIRNFPRSTHQEATDAWRKSQVIQFNDAVTRKLEASLKARSTPELRLMFPHDFSTRIRQWTEGLPSAWQFSQRVRGSRLSSTEDVNYNVRRVGVRDSISNRFIESDPKHLEIARALDEEWKSYLRLLPLEYALFRMSLRPRLWTVASAYFIRNYCVDGVLPVVMALAALAALYDLVDVHALARLAPK